MTARHSLRLGFVASRLGGIDGVSLEVRVWARAALALGHEVCFFAGRLESPLERARTVPMAFFGHPDVIRLNAIVFDPAPEDSGPERIRQGRREIVATSSRLKDELYRFVRDWRLELLVAENTLALPMHVPLGLALTDLAAETRLAVLAHHHDLPWERQRYAVSTMPDIVERAFPPRLPNIYQVCINSQQQRELERRLHRPVRLIPNVVDFADEPAAEPRQLRRLREDLGVHADELLVLQPTRAVPRKGIELALELVRRLGRPAKLVIIGSGSDEDGAYVEHLKELARLLGVDVVWAGERVAPEGRTAPNGRPLYAIDELFAAADLVTYPSLIEGFGRAFLAAVRHRRPLVVNRYPVYDTDLRPHGFRAVEMRGFVSEETVAQTRRLLDDRSRRETWAAHNYELARRLFSVESLIETLRDVLAEAVDWRRERTRTMAVTRPS
jgi:glycosyltransferase involved in cell wall biosynthesis